MAELILKVSDKPYPPESLGEVMVTVKVGQTITLTRQMLMTSSFPPYYQKQGYPIFSSMITGTGKDKANLCAEFANDGSILKQPNFASIDIWGTPVGFKANNTMYNNDLDSTFFEANEVKIKGIAIGIDYVSFIARCVDNKNDFSDWSADIGKLWINVVSATNQPPSAVGDGIQTFDIGLVKILTPAMFTTQTTPVYSDPENDPAYELKLTSLPAKGILTFNGLACKVGDIIPMSQIALGTFRFNDLGVFTFTQQTTFNFELNDMGSQIFKG